MAVYDVWINGESLTTDEYAVDTFEGRRIVPQRSNVNHQFAGMNGVSPAIGSFEEHQFSLEMWVLSAPFGGTPSPRGLEKNLDKILGLFVPNTFMTVSWRDADNGIRSAECLCTAAVTPEIDHLSHFARVKVSFTNPHCFWRGSEKQMTSKVFNNPISVSAVNQSTAVIDDAEFYIKGPIKNPKVISGGSFVEYVGSLNERQALRIRNRAITAELIEYAEGDPEQIVSTKSVVSKLQYTGSNPRFVDLYPRGNVTVGGSGIEDQAYWSVTVTPSYC